MTTTTTSVTRADELGAFAHLARRYTGSCMQSDGIGVVPAEFSDADIARCAEIAAACSDLDNSHLTAEQIVARWMVESLINRAMSERREYEGMLQERREMRASGAGDDCPDMPRASDRFMVAPAPWRDQLKTRDEMTPVTSMLSGWRPVRYPIDADQLASVLARMRTSD